MASDGCYPLKRCCARTQLSNDNSNNPRITNPEQLVGAILAPKNTIEHVAYKSFHLDIRHSLSLPDSHVDASPRLTISPSSSLSAEHRTRTGTRLASPRLASQSTQPASQPATTSPRHQPRPAHRAPPSPSVYKSQTFGVHSCFSPGDVLVSASPGTIDLFMQALCESFPSCTCTCRVHTGHELADSRSR